MTAASDSRPMIAHVVYRFGMGGLENGVANLVNRLPATAYRHAIVALTDVTDFRQRIERDDVLYFSLQKSPGHGVGLYPKLVALFRRLKPSIVHTRNLAALEMTVPAFAAGVPVRIHGEHGRDVPDLDGTSRRYQWARRVYRPFVTRNVAVSADLERYLEHRVGIPGSRITQIYNGVDARAFRPAPRREPIAECPFTDPALWLVGTVGRMVPVKDPMNLVRAFLRMREIDPSADRVRLVIVGDGSLRSDALRLLALHGLEHLAWLPGERHDIPSILRGLDCFALPSLAEGISNTILEAMASGLPVVATHVGGNAELVVTGQTGELVPAGDSDALARALVAAARAPAKTKEMGAAGRARVELKFSLDTMVARYQSLYDGLLRPRAKSATPARRARSY